MALALDGGWRELLASPHVLVYAAATSLCITAYTLSDGLGARAAGTPTYVVWLFVLECCRRWRGAHSSRRAFSPRSGRTGAGLLGGVLSLVAYWIVIWAFTVAPIPIVAALRETSILFALLIGSLDSQRAADAGQDGFNSARPGRAGSDALANVSARGPRRSRA